MLVFAKKKLSRLTMHLYCRMEIVVVAWYRYWCFLSIVINVTVKWIWKPFIGFSDSCQVPRIKRVVLTASFSWEKLMSFVKIHPFLWREWVPRTARKSVFKGSGRHFISIAQPWSPTRVWSNHWNISRILFFRTW